MENVRLREAEPSRMDQTEVWSMTWMGQKPERAVQRHFKVQRSTFNLDPYYHTYYHSKARPK